MKQGFTRLTLIALCVAFMFSLEKDSLEYHPSKTAVLYPSALFQDGDLIFRKGKGFFSDLFSKAGRGKTIYSHVGLARIKEDGVYVIHIDASETTGVGFAKMEPIEIFLADANAQLGALYRLIDHPERYGKDAAEIAETFVRIRIPFDTAFDFETEDSLYCTELVWLAYRKAGVDIIRRLDTVELPILKERFKGIISPGSILNGGKAIHIKNLKENL